MQPQKQMVVVVQLVRTPDCGSGGRGFKSHHPPHFKNLPSLDGRFFVSFLKMKTSDLQASEKFGAFFILGFCIFHTVQFHT